MLKEVICHLSKLLHSIFPVHLLKHIIVPCLDGDVDEGVDSRMVEEVSDGAKLVQHIRRISHPDLAKTTNTLIITLS